MKSASLLIFPGALILAAALCLSPVDARASGLFQLPDDFSVEAVGSYIDLPVGLAFLRDGRLLVIEQRTGNIRLMVEDQLLPDPLFHIPDVNTMGGERGLLGITVDPAWPIRPFVYLLFTRTPGNASRIVRLTASGDLTDSRSGNLSLGNRLEILTDLPDMAPIHNGGTLRFGPDGMLYASLGDDSDPCAAADSTSLRGVILRLNVSWIPDDFAGPITKADLKPLDNPWVTTNDNLGLTFCMGLRNPFRMQIDPLTGVVHIGDVGEIGFEEINEATGGENFGWPFREGPALHDPIWCVEPGGPGANAYDPPIAVYDRAGFTAAVVCAGVYRRTQPGKFSFPKSYDGNLFFADHYQGFVRRLVKSDSGWVPAPNTNGQPSPDNWGAGFGGASDWQEGPDGALYFSNLWNGRVFRIKYRRGPAPGPEPLLREQPILPHELSIMARTEARGTTIHFTQPEDGPVTLTLFDVSGKRVARRSERTLPAGAVEVVWDGKNDAGGAVPSGVYFARVETRRGTGTVRVVVTRPY